MDLAPRRRAAIRISGLIVLAAALSVVLGCATHTAPKPQTVATATVAGGRGTSLVVGLYPYVPRLPQFQDAITAAWEAVHPDVSLTFLPTAQWDGGYDTDPPVNADVFVFDAMFFDYFLSQKWLEALSANEINNLADYLPYATAGVQSGGSYYAIPQLGCTNILFYLKSDAQLAAATTLSQVQAALGQCSYTSDIPPDRRGLMVDLAGGTTNAAMYLDAAYSLSGQTPPLPWNQSQLNTQAIANLKTLLASASYFNATTTPPQAYERGTWFGSGWGRALIDYTEAMSAMSAETRSQIAFKVMPLSDSSNPPYFFADVIAVNPTTNGRGTRALAVQLANVMAASSTMVASLQATSSSPVPQYLMPTRPSVFAQLGATDPIYQQMGTLAGSSNPVMFKVNSQSRAWIAAMKDTIRSSVRSQYPCSCDFVATQFIWNNADAPAICTATCTGHGGWNGQWTNQYPAAQQSSVCGCKACPAPSLATATAAQP